MFNRKRTKSTIIKNGLKTLNQNFKPRQRVTIKYMIINILKKIKNNSAKFIMMSGRSEFARTSFYIMNRLKENNEKEYFY